MLNEYERLHREAVAVHGDRVVLFLQVGSFFEMYWAPGTAGAEAAEAARDRMGLVPMKRKHPGPAGRDNPNGAGFPMHAADKQLGALLDDGWTVCLAEQVPGKTPGAKTERRELTRCVSPGTRTDAREGDCKGRSGNFACCVLRGEGAAMMDVVSGGSVVTDGDGIVAAMESRNVTELVVLGDWDPGAVTREGMVVHRRPASEVLPECEARDVLEQAYGAGPVMTEDLLLLGSRPACRDALAYLLHWTRRHCLQLGVGLPPPSVLDSGAHVRFSPKALQQLEILKLDAVLNRAVTPPGRRWFRHRLCTPFARPQDMRDELERVRSAADTDVDAFRAALARSGDLERLCRGVLQRSLGVAAVEGVVAKLEAAREAAGLSRSAEVCERASGVLEHLSPALQRYRGCEDVVAAGAAVEGARSALDSARAAIHPGARLDTSADGNHKLSLTKARFRGLSADALASLTSVAHLAGGVRVWNGELQALSDALKDAEAALRDIVDAKWAATLAAVDADALVRVAHWARDADVTWTSAWNARRCGHVAPCVLDAAEASFEALELGNPVAEHFMERRGAKERYVRNDVTLNADVQHELLFGINGSGKSCVLRAVGMCVVLAQAGMCVPCASLRLSPFTRIDTRILTPDDVERGLSSYSAELIEMRTALEAASPSSLVLADELCSSTEWRSATALVGTLICHVGDKGSRTFVTTHLGELLDHPSIKDLRALRIAHMGMSVHDRALVYDRTMREGPCMPSYGLLVAGAYGFSAAFIREATCAREIIGGVPDPKRSRYNRRVVVSRCEVCGRPATDTHHLQHRAAAVDGMHGSVPEHHASNLAALCEACHKNAHRPGATLRRVHTVLGARMVAT
jgi:DNA mismatch repair protein MutS